MRDHGVDEPDPAANDQHKEHRKENIGRSAITFVFVLGRRGRLLVHADSITPQAPLGNISRYFGCLAHSITSSLDVLARSYFG